MAWSHNITRWHQTKRRKNRRNKKIRTPINTKTLKSFLGAIRYVAKFLPNLSEKTGNLRQLLKKRTKWNCTTNRNSDFSKRKQELTKLPCLAHYNGNKESIVTTDACRTGLGEDLAKTRQWRKNTNCIRQPLPKRCQTKIFYRRTRSNSRSLVIGKILFPLIR